MPDGQLLHITVKGPKADLWKDFATGQGGESLCGFWKATRKIDPKDHRTFFAQLASFSGRSFGYEASGTSVDWDKCSGDWTSSDAKKLAKLRKYDLDLLIISMMKLGGQFGHRVRPTLLKRGGRSARSLTGT